MTILVVMLENISSDKLDVVLDHFFEAVDYEAKTGFETNVILTEFTNKPVYEKISNEQAKELKETDDGN